MKATPYFRQKTTDEDGNLIGMVVWKVPTGPKHPEGVRYRLAFIPAGHKSPVVLYDNHHPKGHHKHIGRKELPYDFSNIRQLMLDFNNDVEAWKRLKG